MGKDSHGKIKLPLRELSGSLERQGDYLSAFLAAGFLAAGFLAAAGFAAGFFAAAVFAGAFLVVAGLFITIF